MTIANYWELQGGKPSVDEMLAKMRRSEDAVTGTLLARIDPEIARLVVGLKAASQQARRYLTETAEESDGARKMFEDEKATSTHLEELNELADLECRKAKAALAVATTYGERYKLAMALLADVELSLWAYMEDLKEEGDRTTYESISALHDRVVLCLGKESPER